MAASSIKIKAVAVAVVALAKCLIAKDPAFAGQLSQVMDTAMQSGLTPSDLELLRLIVESANH